MGTHRTLHGMHYLHSQWEGAVLRTASGGLIGGSAELGQVERQGARRCAVGAAVFGVLAG
ncbi:hypothetical protein DKP78_15715 [Enterococcus faecium]|nr:hypothetical protein DKP78_15715 [Enterococcus faecium]